MMLCQIPSCPLGASHGNYCLTHYIEVVKPLVLPAEPRNEAFARLVAEQNANNEKGQ